MDDFDPDPVSMPCSNEEARIGMPAIVQLHLVNAALEKNPHPREDYYRQYSITPERRTPEAERTPPPPLYSPRTILDQEKAWAASVAKGLKKFHAGRVMLRKEEAEQHGVLEEEPDFWSSKAKYWQDEVWRLMKEMGKRKKQELKGEAEEGYARAMLLSPLQSPSPPPSNRSLQELDQPLKTATAISDELPKTNMQPHTGPTQKPLQHTPERDPNRDHSANLPKGQKHTRSAVEDYEDESVDQNRRPKRQRRQISTARQKQEPIPATKSSQDAGKNMSKVSKPKAKEGPKTKYQPTPATKRTLPWKLRSRDVISYRETGTNTVTKNRGRPGKKTIRQRKYRLQGQWEHG